MRALHHSAWLGLLLAFSAHGNVVQSFSGSLQHDDELAIFNYTVQNQGAVDITTSSFALGGFAPLVSVFDATGAQVRFYDGYANNSDVPTGAISWVSSAAVEYTVVISEYNNYPLGYLSDGYSQTGAGDFTTALTGFPGPFRDTSGAQLTGYWDITFTSAESSLVVTTPTPTPEPATWVLLLTSFALLVWRARCRPSTN